MGERHDGIPLWVHVALGVAVGLVAGGVLLYWLWAWHTTVSLERAARDWQRASSSAVVRERPTLRAPAVVPSAPAKTGSPCPPSYALGVLNGVTVCVSATGQVVEVLR
jgi:hypothetical protein